jgi:hypothetical protein
MAVAAQGSQASAALRGVRDALYRRVAHTLGDVPMGSALHLELILKRVRSTRGERASTSSTSMPRERWQGAPSTIRSRTRSAKFRVQQGFVWSHVSSLRPVGTGLRQRSRVTPDAPMGASQSQGASARCRSAAEGDNSSVDREVNSDLVPTRLGSRVIGQPAAAH